MVVVLFARARAITTKLDLFVQFYSLPLRPLLLPLDLIRALGPAPHHDEDHDSSLRRRVNWMPYAYGLPAAEVLSSIVALSSVGL